MQNVEKVKEHLIVEEIEKLVEGSENVEENVDVTSSPLRNDDNQVDPDTRLEPRSDKESLEVEKITDISQPMNVIDEEKESTKDDYELRRRAKGKHVEEIRNTPSPKTIRSLTKPGRFRHYKSFFQELQGHYDYLFGHLSAKFMPKRKSHELAKNLEDIMMEALPKLIDDRIKVLLKKQVPLPVVEGLILEREKSQADVAKMIVEAIQRECKNLRLEISLQVNDSISNHIPSQVDSSIRSYMTGHILPSVIHPRDQDDPHDDAHTEGENSAKRKETIVPPYQPKSTLVVQSYQRDLKAPGLHLVNQDLMYLKKGISGQEKI
nr:hypothetical protein [Tanacetum cinerariifolium]